MKCNCNKVKNMLSLYIDDEVSVSEKSYVAEHLMICAECREEYDALKFIIGELNNTQMQPLPLDFKEKLHNRLVEESKSVRRKRFINNTRMYSSIAAGILLTILIGTGYYQRFQPIDNAYVKDIQLKDDVSVKIESVPQNIPQKQEQIKEKLIPSETPQKSALVPKLNIPQSEKERVVNPQALAEIPTATPVIPVATPVIKEVDTNIQIAKVDTQQVPVESQSLKTAMLDAPESTASLRQAPAVSPVIGGSSGGGGGGGAMSAMSAKSMVAEAYKTANIKVDNFKEFAEEITKEYGSQIENESVTLYIAKTDLENIIKISQKYNAEIIYDNVSAKNPTIKCIITSK